MSVAIGSKHHVNPHMYGLLVPMCVLSSSICFELCQFSDFHCGHF